MEKEEEVPKKINLKEMVQRDFEKSNPEALVLQCQHLLEKV
jgi:hypothetical protein